MTMAGSQTQYKSSLATGAGCRRHAILGSAATGLQLERLHNAQERNKLGVPVANPRCKLYFLLSCVVGAQAGRWVLAHSQMMALQYCNIAILQLQEGAKTRREWESIVEDALQLVERHIPDFRFDR